MLERATPILKIVCLVLAALVTLQMARVAARKDPLAGVTAPAILSTESSTRSLSQRAETNATSTTVTEPRATNLPPVLQACVDRIAGSEVFGPLPRPPSMAVALLGIAGLDAFVRAPDGKIGLVREGAEFAGLKVLQIGTNRVLIEQNGRQQELTIFSGFGSDPLSPPGKDNPQ